MRNKKKSGHCYKISNGLNKGLVMPIQNQKKTNRLSTTILNYFAAFTETKFNFRTLINYRWTNNELTLDLAIFQDFQDLILQRIKLWVPFFAAEQV